MAAVNAAEGHDGQAAELAGAANAQWASMSAQALAMDRPITAGYLDVARKRMGAGTWHSAWRRGEAMDVDGAVRLALRKPRAALPIARP